MADSRREFLTKGSMSLMAAAIPPKKQTPATPGAPPAFGTSPAVGPEVTPQTFVEAEKLVQIEMTAKDTAQAAGNWQQSMAAVYRSQEARDL
jgi:hypothetical protein